MTNQQNEILDAQFSVLYKDASRLKRLTNYVIDTSLILVGYIGFLFIVGFGTGLADPKLPEKLESYPAILFVSWILIYYLLSEWLLNGRTLAKYITGTRAIGQNCTDLSAQQIALRSICRLIPFDNFSFLFLKNGFHDMLSDTRVVVWQKQTKW